MKSRPIPTIVVIEDQDDVRDNLLEMLELANFKVLGAANGIEGVQLVREHQPNLVICDVMMPKLDGFGVLKMLHDDENTRNVPVVFLTARSEREDVRRGMNLGASDYIIKPFLQDELLRVVDLRLKMNDTPLAGLKPTCLDEEVAPALHTLRTAARTRRIDNRSTIYFSGDKPHAIYSVVEGRVCLSRETTFGKTLNVDLIGPGGWFGVEDLIAGGVHSLSASAFPEASIQVIDVVDARDALARFPSLYSTFSKQLAQDLSLRAEQLLEIAYLSVRKRIANFLLRTGGKEVPIQLRREDIGEFVGTTPESVTRVLTEFKNGGLVRFPNSGGIIIEDEEAMKNVPS